MLVAEAETFAAPAIVPGTPGCAVLDFGQGLDLSGAVGQQAFPLRMASVSACDVDEVRATALQTWPR